MTTFICTQKEIESGQFKIDDLKKMTLKTDCVIIIKKYATIKNGEVEKWRKQF